MSRLKDTKKNETQKLDRLIFKIRDLLQFFVIWIILDVLSSTVRFVLNLCSGIYCPSISMNYVGYFFHADLSSLAHDPVFLPDFSKIGNARQR